MDQQCSKCGMYLWTEEARASHEAVCPKRDEPDPEPETPRHSISVPGMLVLLRAQIKAVQVALESMSLMTDLLVAEYGVTDEVAKIVAEDHKECGEPIGGVGGPKSCN